MAEGGLLRGLAVGIIFLVLTVIIGFIVVQNVSLVDDNLAANIPMSVINETGGWLNSTNSFTVAQAGQQGFSGFVVTKIVNTSDAANELLAATNYTVLSNGTITNASVVQYIDVEVSYVYEYTPTVGAADRMTTNLTAGIDNVSGKIPTILLIGAVVLLLSVLALLWVQFKKMDTQGSSL